MRLKDASSKQMPTGSVKGLIFYHWCPVKLFRFLPTVEMTRYLEYFGRVWVGGGEAATNPHPKPRKCLSFRSADRRRGI